MAKRKPGPALRRIEKAADKSQFKVTALRFQLERFQEALQVMPAAQTKGKKYKQTVATAAKLYKLLDCQKNYSFATWSN